MVIGNTDAPLTTTPFTANSFPPSGYSASSGGPVNKTGQSSPNATIVVGDLFAELNTAPGAGTRTVALIGDAQTVLVCQISGTETSCNSGSEARSVAPGSTLSISISNGAVAPDPSVGFRWGFRATTP
jgi:hypothetical protein